MFKFIKRSTGDLLSLLTGNMKAIFTTMIVLVLLNACDQLTPPGFRFSLFKNTPVEDLAYAVKRQDIKEIESLIKNNNIDVNYQEKKFNTTVLELAVYHNLEESVKILLENGADPNIINKKLSPLMTACDPGYIDHCETAVLKLLIQYGGDVNAVSQNLNRPDLDQTVLMISVSDVQFRPCNERTYLLVESGADINAIVHNDSTWCAVNAALILDNLEAAKYLLIDKGAKIPTYAYIRNEGESDEQKLTVRQLLNESDFTDDPDRDKLKKEILTFLATKGY